MKERQRQYVAIDMKSFYASVECVERGLDPLDACLIVADISRSDKTICLAASPALKSYGIKSRTRLFEARQRIRDINRRRGHAGKSFLKSELDVRPDLALDCVTAAPRMARYIECSARIYSIYTRYIAPEDIHPYSIDEVFMDVTPYLKTYGMSAHELALAIIRDVLAETGITATAGIGTNLYLCKVAMDLVAKKKPPDKNGVRIAELDEMSYRKLLWEHTPLTDFWRTGPGISDTLASYGIYTMGDIARCSISNEALLYSLFGVNAELLIDHAWGWEPVTMDMIKRYSPESRSLSHSQVLPQPYSAGKARIVAIEMADSLALELVDKGLVTDSVFLGISYQGETPETEMRHRAHSHSHGTANLGRYSSSDRILIGKTAEIFDGIIDKDLPVRRISIAAGNVISEEEARKRGRAVQLELFADREGIRKEEEARLLKEKRRQKAILRIKKQFGKNAILKGTDYEEGATQRERNSQIAGHHE